MERQINNGVPLYKRNIFWVTQVVISFSCVGYRVNMILCRKKHGYLVCLRVLSLYPNNNWMCTVQYQLVSALC
nr:MAG TPA: hypothetical protein [Bacteriophage sp.]